VASGGWAGAGVLWAILRRGAEDAGQQGLGEEVWWQLAAAVAFKPKMAVGEFAKHTEKACVGALDDRRF